MYFVVLNMNLQIANVRQSCQLLVYYVLHNFPKFFFSSCLKKSFLNRLTSDKNSEKFFKVINDRMRDAQAEIKATLSVSTGETLANKADEERASGQKDASKNRSMHHLTYKERLYTCISILVTM